MDGWRHRFKQAVVRAGPLEGARYLDVTADWLTRAGRHYPEDKRFEKFARMASDVTVAPDAQPPAAVEDAALLERPCRVARRAAVPLPLRLFRQARAKLVALPKSARLWLLLSCLLFLAKPLAVVVLARLLGAIARLVLRRVLHLVGHLAEQLLEELLQQASEAVTVPFSAGHGQCPAQLSWPLLTQLLLTVTTSMAGAFGHYLYIRLCRRVMRVV
ncbi:unnamed protein product [Symbiodinium sp. CCMP2592]|nr:unnamed protein product [Symbiodinium sp. CCMP2592]